MESWTITRENNKYNKYLKWHLVGVCENGGVFSSWYKTQREALYYKDFYSKEDKWTQKPINA